MPLIIPKTSISFSDDGKSVEIIVDGASKGAFPKNKFSVIPSEGLGVPDIDLVWYDNEKSEESFFRFPYTLISPVQASRADAVTYLRGLFFLAPVSNGGSPTFTNLIVSGLSTLLNLIVTGATTLANLVVNGFTQWGSDAPPVKMKFYTATLPSFVGSSTSFTLTGMDASKILGISVLGMWSSGGAFMSNHFTWISSYEYDWYTDNGTVNPTIYLCLANNAYSMTNKPVNIIVFYSNSTVNPI